MALLTAGLISPVIEGNSCWARTVYLGQCAGIVLAPVLAGATW